MQLVRVLVPLAGAGVPDWVAAAVVVASMLLAVLVVVLMLRPVRPAPGERDAVGGQQSATIDPVLLLSALAVMLLAVAVWLLS